MHPKSAPSGFHEGRSLTSYLRSPMGTAGSPEIFPSKDVRAYGSLKSSYKLKWMIA
jgi:hypothetical protein